MTPNISPLAWLPDGDPTQPGVLVNVENLVPTARGYASDGSLVASLTQPSGVTIPDETFGAALATFALSGPCVVVGTEDKIYSVAAALYNISGGSPYTPVTSHVTDWRFATFEDALLVTQVDNGLQASTAASSGTALTAVSGAPGGWSICRAGDFVMMGGVRGGGWSDYPDGWWCSARGDYTDWTPDVATQCARGRLLQTPGGIVRVVPFQNYILAFKGTSVIRGTYVGTPVIWRWDVVSTSIGLIAHDAIVEANGVLYWMGLDGFYRFDGSGIQRIASAPWRWLRANTEAIAFQTIKAQWDPVRRLVRWYYPQSFVSPLIYDKGLAYHPDTDRWGRFDSDIAEAINGFFEQGVDESGAIPSAVPFAPLMIDSGGAFVTFGTTTGASSMTTGDIGDDDSVTTMLRVRARYLRAPLYCFVTHYHRMNLGDSLVTGESSARNDGKFDISHGARWHRLLVTHSGPHEVTGFSVDPARTGKR